jgi:alkylated DNA nucleotide flippase Atl1
VANFCKKNWDTDIPCHRVVHADGRVGKYNRDGGEEAKIKKLHSEGVKVVEGYVRD